VSISNRDVFKSIRATITNKIDISTADLKPSTSFIELNIDSLLTLNIISKLSEEIEIDLLRNLLTDNNSMDKV
jgi:acyl carrier protein